MLCCLAVVVGKAQQSTKKMKAAKPLTVFTVNKKPVTAEEFMYLYNKNHQHNPADYSNEKIEEYLTLFINFKLKVEEAEHRGYDTTAAFKREYNSYKDELRKPYLPDSKMTDSLVRLTYSRMKEEVRASHILVNVKPDATPDDTVKAYNKILDIRNKALAGDDFGNLAAAYSEDPSAKLNKGDLGYFTALQMVYPFETAAYTTPVGQISMPIRTKFGYHIVKVADRRPTRGEVEVSHIMIRTGDNKDNQKAKNTIFEVYDQLNAGVSWDELCKQYSEDPGTKDNGGRMRAFGAGFMNSVPAFESAAFSLQKPGEISDPFQTQYGWHIVRLEKKIPLATYEELSSSLKNKVLRDERAQISKQAMQKKLRKDYRFAENAAVKSIVMSWADSTLVKGKWNPRADAKTEKEVLFTLAGKACTVRDFMAYVYKNQRPSGTFPARYLDQLYNGYVDADILQLFEQNLTDNNPEYRMLLKEYYEGILLFEIMEKEVWSKASDDSLGQRKYYDANTGTYKAGERVKGVIYSAPSHDVLEALHALVKQGDSLKIQEYTATQKIRHETGSFEKESKPVLAKIDWAPGVQESESGNTYYLVWIKAILPPGIKSFEEARAAVISDYQNYLEKTWLDMLRKKYPVRINEKGKNYVLAHLQK